MTYQQHFTMTLIGEDCHRLLANSEDIIDGLRMILFQELSFKVARVRDRMDQEIDKLSGQLEELIVRMKDVMAILNYIISVMKEDRAHSDEECDIFKKAFDYLGYIWRHYGLHHLECHSPIFCGSNRRFFGENGIERDFMPPIIVTIVLFR